MITIAKEGFQMVTKRQKSNGGTKNATSSSRSPTSTSKSTSKTAPKDSVQSTGSTTRTVRPMNTTGRFNGNSRPPEPKPGDTSHESYLKFDISDVPPNEIVYRVQDTETFFNELEKDLRRKSPPRVVENFEDLDTLRQFLTPQRQLLFRVLRRKEFGSVYELAKFMKREYKAIVEDLKVLREMGLLRFETEVVNGRARSKPVLTRKKIVIEFS